MNNTTNDSNSNANVSATNSSATPAGAHPASKVNRVEVIRRRFYIRAFVRDAISAIPSVPLLMPASN